MSCLAVLADRTSLRLLLATDPDALTKVFDIVYRTIAGHLLTKAGLTRVTGAIGAMTLEQRIGSVPALPIG
jgi:hypothetical protein